MKSGKVKTFPDILFFRSYAMSFSFLCGTFLKCWLTLISLKFYQKNYERCS